MYLASWPHEARGILRPSGIQFASHYDNKGKDFNIYIYSSIGINIWSIYG